MQNQRQRIEKLVSAVMICKFSSLMKRFLKDRKYYEELIALMGTPWLAERIRAHGQLVADLCDLAIWQSIALDAVIEDIALESYKFRNQ